MNLKIIVDAFGGDNAPLETLKGCELAVKEFGVEILLAGSPQKIESCAKENSINLNKMVILPAEDVFEMSDPPMSVLKDKRGTSLAAGLDALARKEGNAFVSAGSTGALTLGATFIVKRLRGVKRPAIASVMPTAGLPCMLLDSGANAECTASHLLDFARMGEAYMRLVHSVKSPRVALVNIGTEKEKGDSLRLETFELLSKEPFNFIGNIEAREIPFGGCDVAVADGFTGNIILKLYEGVAGAMMANLKDIYKKNAFTMLSAAMVRGGLSDFKRRMDYTEFGGAPLLGLNEIVIKAHGSSNAKAFKNAIGQAVNCCEKDLINIFSSEEG